MAKKGTINEGKLWAILSYIFILWIFPIWVIKPKNKFAVYHAKQGLVLFIAAIILSIITSIPFFGWFIGFAGWLIWVVLFIIGIVNAVNNKKKPLPLIGQFAKKFDF